MPPAFPPTMQIPPHLQPNQPLQQHQLPPPPLYPSSQPQTLSAASSINNNLNSLNQSGMGTTTAASDQPNQSMINNLSFQSERTPFNQNRTLNLNGTMPSSANSLNQQQQQMSLNKQHQQQPSVPIFNTNAYFGNIYEF